MKQVSDAKINLGFEFLKKLLLPYRKELLESLALELIPDLCSNAKDYHALLEKNKNKPPMPWDQELVPLEQPV